MQTRGLRSRLRVAAVLIVEFDDSSHNRYKRQQRDKLINSICQQAGLRIVHIKARASYSARIIRNILDDRLRRA